MEHFQPLNYQVNFNLSILNHAAVSIKINSHHQQHISALQIQHRAYSIHCPYDVNLDKTKLFVSSFIGQSSKTIAPIFLID
jgi:hypothetical protein